MNAPSRLGFNKLVRLQDFTDPELIEAIRDVCAHKIDGFGPQFPEGAEHRKDWEVAMAIRALREFGALHAEARILGVAAGHEDTIFYLTRHAKEVVAVDLYMMPGAWSPVAPRSMLVDPELLAPFEFDADRLVVRHMDGRWLRFPDNTFDGIFSSGSIEHFGTFDDVANAAYEMGRVLKPGGVLTLSTEFRLDGPLGGIGWPGNMLLFSTENLQRYIVDASGLELVDELDTSMSPDTSDTRVGLTTSMADHQANVDCAADKREYLHWDFPHVVLVHEDYLFCSVHLALRKPDNYPVVDNSWARPSKSTRDAIRRQNLEFVGAASQAGTLPAAPPPPPDSTPVPVSGPMAEQQAAIAAEAAASARAEELLTARVAELRARSHDMALAAVDVDRCVEAVSEHLDEVAALEIALADNFGDSQPLSQQAGPPQSKTGVVLLDEGVSFEVLVDRDAEDPTSQALGEGWTYDKHLLSLMLGLFPPGGKLLDLGGHVGTFSLAAAGAGGSALAVEAAPRNASLLRASVARNGFSHVHVVQAAVSDQPGNVQFRAKGPWGHVVTGVEPNGNTGTTISVPTVSLSELLVEFNWFPLNFVKIDVEGFEIPALRSMAEFLQMDGAPPMLCESNGHTLRLAGWTPEQLLAELANLGYRCYLVEPNRLVGVDPFVMQPQTLVDYLAVKMRLPPLPGWQIDEQMTFEERVSRVVTDCEHANPHHPAYIGPALSRAEELLGHPDVAASLDRLREHPDPDVRAGVEWWDKR